MTPIAWAVQLPDGRIDHELVGTQREVEWWCSTDEGRVAGRRSVALYLREVAQTVEPRSKLPEVAGSIPALASSSESDF
jgi:hypothetical protein